MNRSQHNVRACRRNSQPRDTARVAVTQRIIHEALIAALPKLVERALLDFPKIVEHGLRKAAAAMKQPRKRPS